MTHETTYYLYNMIAFIVRLVQSFLVYSCVLYIYHITFIDDIVLDAPYLFQSADMIWYIHLV